jgi:hypothetical protein
MLSQNSLVDIEGKLYIIGGIGTVADSSVFAIPLSSDLHSVSGKIIPLVKKQGHKFTKSTSAKYSDGLLYINYVKAADQKSFQHLGVFDVKKDFAPLYDIPIQDVSVDTNHASMEILDGKVYFVYQENQKKNSSLLMQVFEWK